MARNEVRVHASAQDDASKTIDNIKDKLTSMKEAGAQGAVIGASAAITAKGLNLVAGAADEAATAVIGFAEDSIAKASDLNETMSKAEVIFGDNSDAVEKWAETMDRSAGQSKKAALDAASGFAGLFKTVGLGIDESTAKSEKLTQLGSDLASFFNTDVGDALDAIKSGLNGEAEPLRKFNIFLSETAVNDELVAEKQKKVNGQWTEGQKATARYNLILKQTTDAQGDFARTSDGLANSQRVTAAEIDNLQAEIGQELLPVVKDLSNWAKDEGVPAFKQLVEAVKEAEPAFDALGTIIPIVNSNGKSGQEVGRDLAESWFGVADATDEAAAGMGSVADVLDQTGQSLDDFRDGERDLTDAATHASVATYNLADANTDLHHKYAPVLTDLRTLKQKFDDATTAIEDDMFAVDLLKRSLHEGKDALKDDIDHLHKLEAIKHPTRAQREDIDRTKDSIVEDKKQIIDNSLKLLSMGKITFPQLLNQLKLVGIHLMDDTDAARKLRALLYQLDSATGGRTGHGGGGGSGLPKVSGGNASGGTIPVDEWHTVGEKGMELAHAKPGGGVDIFPLSGSAVAGYGGFLGGGGSPSGAMTVNINVSTPILSPGGAQALADAIAPHLTRWQQSRGLVPR